MSKPRAKTVEDVRKEFLEKIKACSRYYANLPNKTPLERCNGLAFSILNIFDGTSALMPAMDIVLRPHEDDKEFHRGEGDNWYEDGMVINECHLHELFYKDGA